MVDIIRPGVAFHRQSLLDSNFYNMMDDETADLPQNPFGGKRSQA
jgi:hypothetical protein